MSLYLNGMKYRIYYNGQKMNGYYNGQHMFSSGMLYTSSVMAKALKLFTLTLNFNMSNNGGSSSVDDKTYHYFPTNSSPYNLTGSVAPTYNFFDIPSGVLSVQMPFDKVYIDGNGFKWFHTSTDLGTNITNTPESATNVNIPTFSGWFDENSCEVNSDDIENIKNNQFMTKKSTLPQNV